MLIQRALARRVLILLSAMMLVAVACGTDEGDGAITSATLEKITAIDRTFSFDDLKAAGFKKAKTYDVEGLEKATDAYWGFYGPDPYKRKDYEIRFYASHADAVEYGIPMADHASGEDALLKKDNVIWADDLTERRECKGHADDVGVDHQIGQCLDAKYAEYIVYGNMIMLCEGLDVHASMVNCAALLAQFPESATP